MTSVVKIQRKGGKIILDCDVYIGRQCSMGGWNLQSSKWANPFPISKYGRDGCLKMYKEYILKKIKEDPITYNLEELRGKTLGCWCTNSTDTNPAICHGLILMSLLE